MNYKGVIIKESLRNSSVLQELKILQTKIEPVTSMHKTPWLRQWTLLTIEVPEKKSDEIGSIIEEAVSLRNDLIARVNNPDGKDNPKIVRKFYQLIESDLNSGVDNLCKQLSAISSKKKK